VDLSESFSSTLSDSEVGELDASEKQRLDTRAFLLWLKNYAEINPECLQSISDHAEQYGELLSIYELQSIACLGKSDLSWLHERVEIKNGIQSGTSRHLSAGWIIGRHIPRAIGLKREKSDSLSFYEGDAWKFLQKIEFESPFWSMRWQIQKDIGEKWWQKNSLVPGPDHSSYTLQKYFSKSNSKLILGDYQIHIGQGLSYRSSFGFGRSSDLSNTAQTGWGIREYRSIDENISLRGAAIQIPLLKDLELISAVSRKFWDARLSEDSISVTSLDLSGLHRSENELAKYHQILEHLGLLALKWKIDSKNLAAEIQSFAGLQHFDKNIENRNVPLIDYGLAFQLYWRGWHIFSELQQINSHLLGARKAIHSKIDIQWIWRRYSPDYSSLRGSGWAAGSNPANEQGLLSSLIIYPNSKCKLQLFLDWQSPVDIEAGSLSANRWFWEASARADFKISKKYRAYLIASRDQEHQDSKEHSDLAGTRQLLRLRLHLVWNPSLKWSLQFRTEHKISRKVNHESSGSTFSLANPLSGVIGENSQILYADIKWKPAHFRNRLSLRYRSSLFAVPSSDLSLYAYEPGFPGQFLISGYFDDGISQLLLIKWKGRRWDLAGKARLLWYSDREKPGSGLDQIDQAWRINLELYFKIKFEAKEDR
jgi:hypothetical protein